MPKQVINLIGILVSVAVLALGVFLVAMPLATQALAVYGQADQVAQTNTLYQAQVDALNKAKENKAQTDESVAALRAQIPMTPQLDDVFDLVARASQASGTSITSVTAGTAAPFVVRTDATALKDEKPAPSPSPTPTPSASAGGSSGSGQQPGEQSGTGGQTESGAKDGATDSRTQIDFSINVAATDMGQVTAFLDALRSGPRLLSNITSVVTQNGTGIQVQVTALTFVDTATATKVAK